MIEAIDNGQLTTDLNANGFNILHVGNFTPPPPNVIVTTDPRLSDMRDPLPASVTNGSVNDNAAISQSKLNLNGNIPIAWLGFLPSTAAQGNLAEYIANKNQPFGYCGLDGSAKVPVLQLPPDVGSGTITSVGVSLPAQFSVSGSPVTTSGTIAVTWAAIPDGSWFGNSSGGSAVPIFQTTPIPVSLVPNLPASIITSGTLAASLLPTAIGVGVTHAPGAVPDPGASGATTDYLARDMTYKTFPSIGPSYQPAVPDPVLIANSVGPPSIVAITESLFGVSLFYKLSISSPTYLEAPASMTVSVPHLEVLSVYGSKAGYNNSNVVTYTAP